MGVTQRKCVHTKPFCPHQLSKLLQWSSQTVLISISEENWKISMKQFNYIQIWADFVWMTNQSGLSFLPGLFRFYSIKEGADINDTDCGSSPALPPPPAESDVINFIQQWLRGWIVSSKVGNSNGKYWKTPRQESPLGEIHTFPGGKNPLYLNVECKFSRKI